MRQNSPPTRRSQFGLRLDLGLGPRFEFGDGGFPGVDISSPGLVDRHCFGLDVIQVTEGAQRSERIEHELRVVLGLDEGAPPMLQVDDLQFRFGNDDTVAGAEPTRNHVGEVEALLDQHLRITIGLPCKRDVFLDEGDVVIDQLSISVSIQSDVGLKVGASFRARRSFHSARACATVSCAAAADIESGSRDSSTALGRQFSHRCAPDAESNACWSGIGQLLRLGEQPPVLCRVNRRQLVCAGGHDQLTHLLGHALAGELGEHSTHLRERHRLRLRCRFG